MRRPAKPTAKVQCNLAGYISSEREFFQMRSYSSADDQDHIIADEFNGFQDLEIEFPAAEKDILWPRVFEEHLRAFPPAHISEKARARAQSSSANGNKIESRPAGVEWKNVPFRGVGADTEYVCTQSIIWNLVTIMLD